MIKNKELSIIIPAYNEERRIGKVLENYLDSFHDIEILIAIDGCKDGTLDIVKKYSENGSKNNNLVSYTHFNERLGKGMGILRAIDHTKGDIIAVVDADESTHTSEILRLVNSLDGYDCIIGSRWLPESKVLKKQTIQRRIASRGFNFLVRTMFDIHFKDTQCGAKVFRKEVVKSVIGNMSTFDFAFDIDLLWQLQKKGYKIKEVPIVWSDNDGSSVKLFREIVTMFLSIVRLRLVNSRFNFLIRNNAVVYIYNRVRGEKHENSNF